MGTQRGRLDRSSQERDAENEHDTPLGFENRTLSSSRPSFAASRLTHSQNQIIKNNIPERLPLSDDKAVLRRPLEPGQYTSFDFRQVLDDHNVLGSIGSVGDAYDNALAESFVDSFKTELIADRVWRTRSQLELAIVEWAGWFNHARLHSALDDRPPAEFERTELAGHQLSFNHATLI
jgi:hypothetical protein